MALNVSQRKGETNLVYFLSFLQVIQYTAKTSRPPSKAPFTHEGGRGMSKPRYLFTTIPREYQSVLRTLFCVPLFGIAINPSKIHTVFERVNKL